MSVKYLVIGKPEKINGTWRLSQMRGSKSRGDRFIWEAPADSAMTIDFTQTGKGYGDPLSIGKVNLQPGDQLGRNVSHSKLYNGFHYKIFIGKDEVQGNSDPEIIIDD